MIFFVIFEVIGGQLKKLGEANIARKLCLNFYQNRIIFRHICPKCITTLCTLPLTSDIKVSFLYSFQNLHDTFFSDAFIIYNEYYI